MLLLHRFVVIVAGLLLGASAFAQGEPASGLDYVELKSLQPPALTPRPRAKSPTAARFPRPGSREDRSRP